METVDWASLEHMYGSAADMPDTFRALKSDDLDERRKARQYLWDAVYHQGDFESASPHVIRALIDLLLEKDVPDRHELLVFIPQTLGLVHAYTEFGGEMRRGDLGEAHHEFGMASYRVGVENLASFFALAQGPGARTRGAAVRALAVFTTEKDRILSFFDSLQDDSEQVRASVVWSRHELTKDKDDLRRAHAEDPSLLVRATAAFLLWEGPDEALAATLRAAIQNPEMPFRIFRIDINEFFDFGLNIGAALNRAAPGDPLADTEFDSEEPPDSVPSLSVDEHPEVGATWHQLSLVERQAGNPAQALAAANKAISLSPDEAPYYANRAALRQSIEDARTAVDRDPAILPALESDPDLASLRATPEWSSVREIAR